MQTRNVPRIDWGYWVAILVASMCGANSGDYLARVLHLGHANGLLPLAAVFLAIISIEHWSKWMTVAWYWLAIIVLRTGATNLADLATHDFKLNYQIVEAALAALMLGFIVFDRARAPASSSNQVPETNGWYWAAMLTAGTLGTVFGDDVADNTPLGVGMGSIVLFGVFIAVLLAAWRIGSMTKPWYWLTVIAARTVGTTMGDFLASRKGANLGLSVSLLITSALLAAVVVVWSRTSPAVSAPRRA